jgi:hypothetical protein
VNIYRRRVVDKKVVHIMHNSTNEYVWLWCMSVCMLVCMYIMYIGEPGARSRIQEGFSSCGIAMIFPRANFSLLHIEGFY